jgi:putative transposase
MFNIGEFFMANTYTQIYIHVVFTVQGRLNLITKENREELQKYISGIVQKRGQKMLSIFSMPDHTHILISLNSSIAISDLVRDIKSASSKFINDKKWIVGKFNWQEGFGAFSYSRSQINNVINYINNQEGHHKKKTFKEEYIELLKLFEIEYNEKYLFDWIV